MKNILLSGGTGLVGSNIIQEALERGIHVYVLTRGENAQDRTINTIKTCFTNRNFCPDTVDKLLSLLHIYNIHWDHPEKCFLQIDYEHSQKNIKFDAIIHCASDMTYSRMNIFASYNQNVLATDKFHEFFSRRFHKLCHKNARFYFYSTAYSCGINNHKQNECLHINANAPSVYHLTKSYIEKELWIKTHYNPEEKSHLPITIIRPSAIIGRSDNGDFGTHYIGLADVLSIFRDNITSNKHITLDIQGNSEINFVPANIIAKWNINLIGHQNKIQDIYNIFHFTALKGITKDALFQKISELYDISISYGSVKTKNDTVINKKLKKHKLYLENEWCFSRENLNKVLDLSSKNDDFDILSAVEKIYPNFTKQKELLTT